MQQIASPSHPELGNKQKRTRVTGLYVTGGRHKPVGLRAREEWVTFENGLILRVDPARGDVKCSVEYTTPESSCAKDGSITFESGTLQGDLLYTCTRTEAMVYRIPTFDLVRYVTLPSFNDVHHVRPTAAGNLLVTSTGLDMVIEVDRGGKVLREWDVLEGRTWTRFSSDIDYRRVLTTKPHLSHPNYTFFLDGEVWVTRAVQRDAYCLTNRTAPIDLGPEVPHDGEVRGDRIYFTTVNGAIIIVNAKTRKRERIVDLNKLDNSRGSLGWCRGAAFVDESLVWVGFSRLRKTRFKENTRWVKDFIKGKQMPTHLALYDITAEKRLAVIDLEPYGMHVVFGIFPTDVG